MEEILPSDVQKRQDSFFYFSPDYLQPLGEKLTGSYAKAEPFPHIVMDNFIPEDEILKKVIEEFPNPEHPPYEHNSPAQRKKMTQPKDYLLGPYTRHLMSQFNSATFVRFLETLTGIKGLIPDPYFLGGGVHQTYPGGFLKIHTDFSRYPELNLRRRLNVLLYLNPGWKEEWGGACEFWDPSMSKCVDKASPIYNRCVVFSTTRFSYHGHPDPITCPEGVTRKSLALYYYTVADPEGQAARHGTLFIERPGEKWFYLRNLIARCVPPIFYDAAIFIDKKLKRSSRI